MPVYVGSEESEVPFHMSETMRLVQEMDEEEKHFKIREPAKRTCKPVVGRVVPSGGFNSRSVPRARQVAPSSVNKDMSSGDKPAWEPSVHRPEAKQPAKTHIKSSDGVDFHTRSEGYTRPNTYEQSGVNHARQHSEKIGISPNEHRIDGVDSGFHSPLSVVSNNASHSTGYDSSSLVSSGEGDSLKIEQELSESEAGSNINNNTNSNTKRFTSSLVMPSLQVAPSAKASKSRSNGQNGQSEHFQNTPV